MFISVKQKKNSEKTIALNIFSTIFGSSVLFSFRSRDFIDF